MSEDIQKDIEKLKGMQLLKRSSLKQNKNESPISLKDKPESKRRSVNWDMSSFTNLKSDNMKEMKITFDQSSNRDEQRKYSDYEDEITVNKFFEKRKSSIKNEYTLAKEMMRQKEEMEDDEKDYYDGQIIENTKKNKEIGLKTEREEEDSFSSNSEEEKGK